MQLLLIGMTVVWMMLKKKCIHEIYIGEISYAANILQVY